MLSCLMNLQRNIQTFIAFTSLKCLYMSCMQAVGCDGGVRKLLVTRPELNSSLTKSSIHFRSTSVSLSLTFYALKPLG